MAENATVNIPKDVIDPIVRQQLSAAIAAAMGDPVKIINAIVTRALDIKVDKSGKVSSYSYDNTQPFLEALSHKLIRDEAEKLIREYVQDHRELIKKQIVALLSKRRNGTFAEALLVGAEKSLENFSLTIHLDRKRS